MATKKRKLKAGPLLQNPLFAIAAVAVVVFIIVSLFKSGGTNSKYFCQGIYINSVDMSSYTKEQGKSMLEKWSSSLLDQSYTFTFEDKNWFFTPSDFKASYNTGDVLQRAWNLGHTGNRSDQSVTQQNLRYNPQEFWIELSYDEDKLDSFIDSIYNEVYIAPVDADIVITATKPVVVADSTDGRELNREAFKETLVNLMKYRSDSTLMELPVEEKLPAVSSSAAEDGLQQIVSYATDLSASSTSRCGNVRLALSNFNGFAVRPGETVSFNEVVGERSAVRGYAEGTVYYGENVTTGMGGGVCQASSTLYGALMYAGMDVIERNHHNMVVDYCPPSMDAAVSEDALQDFIFVNNTDYTIYIYTEVINKVEARVTIYGSHPEYRIELVPTITQNNIKNPAINMVEDKEGTYCYYKTQTMLIKEGKLGRRSTLERVYYDRDTGVEVKRELLSDDYYSGERDTYYIGTHSVDEPLPGTMPEV